MNLILAKQLDVVREKYIEVIEKTENMSIYARWKYGQHPTDDMLQTYIDNDEMYVYMDHDKVAGLIAVTMYQGEDYESIPWDALLHNDEVAVLHILTVCPEYQKMGVAGKMVLDVIELAKKSGKKAVRLDALASNIPAQHLYEGLGFSYKGKQNLYAENTGWADFFYYELIL